MTLCFVGTLLTSGAVWMIGSDRIQAAAAYDGAFFPWFGVFNERFGTPVRVNVMSALGSFVAVFPGVLEKIFNVPYNFHDEWGLSRAKFEAYTLGTLAVIVAFGVVGYYFGSGVRHQIITGPPEPEPAPAD